MCGMGSRSVWRMILEGRGGRNGRDILRVEAQVDSGCEFLEKAVIWVWGGLDTLWVWSVVKQVNGSVEERDGQ